MKFLKTFWKNMGKILLIILLMGIPISPVIIAIVFGLDPIFILLIIPLIAAEWTFLDCYGDKLDAFCKRHNLFDD